MMGGFSRFAEIAGNVSLPSNFTVLLDVDNENPQSGRYYYQIECYRRDVITGEMGLGYGGKAYLSEHATDSELVQTIFGLYKGYLEHEARETFQYRGIRVFGPHIDITYQMEAAKHVDIRSAQHKVDAPR